MKTIQTEIFEQQDVREETVEQSEEALRIINDLGLTGQQPKSNTTGTIVRFPYRLMTDEELFVYSILCPQKSDLRFYDLSPIPLEVLKTAAYAKSLQDPRIQYLEIWSAVSQKVKDPVLVGKKETYSSSQLYILARWGEELLPLDVLMPDAVKKWYTTRNDKLNQILAEVKLALATPVPQGLPERTGMPYLSL